MNKSEFLKTLGLSSTESSLYLTGLSFDSIGVSELVKMSGIQRTTVYHALETLEQKGLVTKKYSGGRLVFSMAQPQHIKKFIDRNIGELNIKKAEFEKILPELEKFLPGKVQQTSVQHFQGIEAIKSLVETALYCKNRKWQIIAPINNFFAEFDPTYAQYFMDQRIKNGIIARSLWEDNKNGRALTAEDQKMRNPRILPEVMRGKFRTVVLIFDDKVAFISSIKQLSGILISSEELHQTMLTIFDGLWAASKPAKLIPLNKV